MLRSKILSPSALTKKFASKKRGLVFTNGCFDILHAGHVTYLEKAKKLGKTLIVAVNTDASVQKLKGPTRPINPLKDRLTVLAALESIDFVTWFDDKTPLKLIQKLLPEILVKGGDYKPDAIVGASEVKAAGGKVKVIGLVKGRSTSAIITKAKN